MRLTFVCLFFCLSSFASQKDAAFCRLTNAAVGDRASMIALAKQISERSKEPDGWVFLGRHLEELQRTAFLPDAWTPLATLPEAVVPNLVRADGGEAFEVVGLVGQLAIAQGRDVAGKHTPQAASAHYFLSAALGPAGAAGHERTGAFAEIAFGAVGLLPTDVSHIVKPCPTHMAMDARLRNSEHVITRLGNPAAMGELYANLDKLVDGGYLADSWANPFALRPKRSPGLLNAPLDPRGQIMIGMETVSILRMIKFAETHPDPAMKKYARDWLNTLFGQPAGPQAKMILGSLERLYGEKVPR